MAFWRASYVTTFCGWITESKTELALGGVMFDRNEESLQNSRLLLDLYRVSSIESTNSINSQRKANVYHSFMPHCQ